MIVAELKVEKVGVKETEMDDQAPKKTLADAIPNNKAMARVAVEVLFRELLLGLADDIHQAFRSGNRSLVTASTSSGPAASSPGKGSVPERKP